MRVVSHKIFIISLFVKNIAHHHKEIRETIRKFAAMAWGQVRSENVVTKTGDHCAQLLLIWVFVQCGYCRLLTYGACWLTIVFRLLCLVLLVSHSK